MAMSCSTPGALTMLRFGADMRECDFREHTSFDLSFRRAADFFEMRAARLTRSSDDCFAGRYRRVRDAENAEHEATLHFSPGSRATPAIVSRHSPRFLDR